VILHITSPSKDPATKAMYDRFMAEENCPFYIEDHILGFLMGARMEEDGYVLTVSITDQYAKEHFNELMSRLSRPAISSRAVA
jgi:hypothetical protein